MLKISILAPVILLAATSPAGAHGAIAIGGNPASAETRGIAVGVVQNYDTSAVAEAEAIKKCLAFTGAPKKTVALCKIVRTFRHEWVVVALDPKPSTPGFGWSIDPDKAIAERNAMDQCKVSSSTARKAFCEVAGEMGDTKP